MRNLAVLPLFIALLAACAPNLSSAPARPAPPAGSAAPGARLPAPETAVRLSTPEGSGSKVHPYYADQGAFEREVAEGDNVFDFEIESRPKALRSGR